MLYHSYWVRQSTVSDAVSPLLELSLLLMQRSSWDASRRHLPWPSGYPSSSPLATAFISPLATTLLSSSLLSRRHDRGTPAIMLPLCDMSCHSSPRGFSPARGLVLDAMHPVGPLLCNDRRRLLKRVGVSCRWRRLDHCLRRLLLPVAIEG